MFDLFEHLTTTLRRTFAAEEPVAPVPAGMPGQGLGPLEPVCPVPQPGAVDLVVPGRGSTVAASAAGPSEGPEPPLPLSPAARSGIVLAGASHVPAVEAVGAAGLDEAAGDGGWMVQAGAGPVRTVVVIPAYNEASTLPEVIRAAKAVPEVSEVIVVSDGSTDETAAVARENGAICIELRQNVGKGGAMKVGIDRADADVYVFLDADLIGVTPAHIQAMLHPVLRRQAPVAIAQLDGGRVATDLASVVAPNLSGQRAVTRAILQGMSGMETTRFGVEIAMKRYIKRNRVPMVRVPLDISHRTKEEKMGLLRGFLARMKEYWEIVKVAGE